MFKAIILISILFCVSAMAVPILQSAQPFNEHIAGVGTREYFCQFFIQTILIQLIYLSKAVIGNYTGSPVMIGLMAPSPPAFPADLRMYPDKSMTMMLN